MEKLVRGLHEFQKTVFSAHRDLFERLSRHGQNPEALFITCSDSRINPNLLTQTQPGDIFIIRNAGNLIPPYGSPTGGEGATIEYAVSALNVKDIIVCGHSHCGAMDALENREQLASSMPLMGEWLKHADATRRIIRENYSHLLPERKKIATIEENVLVQLDHLRTYPAVRARINRGDLHLHGWVYKIETGEVFAYDIESENFIPLVAQPAPLL